MSFISAKEAQAIVKSVSVFHELEETDVNGIRVFHCVSCGDVGYARVEGEPDILAITKAHQKHLVEKQQSSLEYNAAIFMSKTDLDPARKVFNKVTDSVVENHILTYAKSEKSVPSISCSCGYYSYAAGVSVELLMRLWTSHILAHITGEMTVMLEYIRQQDNKKNQESLSKLQKALLAAEEKKTKKSLSETLRDIDIVGTGHAVVVDDPGVVVPIYESSKPAKNDIVHQESYRMKNDINKSFMDYVTPTWLSN